MRIRVLAGMMAIGVLMAGTPARAHERVLACPARLLGHPLRNGQVMDGPPQDIAILRGDDLAARGDDAGVIWRVGHLARVSLECEYAVVGKAYLTVSGPVKTCRYSQHGDMVRLSCR